MVVSAERTLALVFESSTEGFAALIAILSGSAERTPKPARFAALTLFVIVCAGRTVTNLLVRVKDKGRVAHFTEVPS